ncbi:aminotransferase class I/II-fold pyridoxal phosphate-dependent enzyme [Rhodocaloribacter litoris]|uniref:pyridoxal phosphate-dependent decarboxylase family protein n=1 Tax=Rhodocaloribacter litoris TaxID=2558931 RepID=UPI001E35AA1C|nr:aminotransferase class I/II-fold pyridoxal phosphate-dependent enzyme [Rhodocaloribacter litoris]QXD16364.1 aminotransferase class I/II-fold pyridoxal phosphate-dependent enzyme [Rhodocaloribacter litoris]
MKPETIDLDALETAARQLDPDARERARLMKAVFAYADRYLESLPDQPAYFDRPDNGRALRETPIPEEGIGLDAALELLRQHVDTVGINPTSGRFLGYIPGGGLFHAALGDFLAAVTNRYAGVFFAGPGAVRIENLLIRWMARLAGYPETAAGYLAAGGSLANLTAIVTARDDRGLEGDAIARAVVYFTEHVHHSVNKALRLAGLRRLARRRIPVDTRYRMDAAALERAIEADRRAGLAPWMVIASAGTTNTGSVDPLDTIGQIAAAHGLWYHIDAAYGGFFALCEDGAALLRGMNRSDSLVMDPHKTLFLPYGTGALLVRDGQKLHAAHAAEADYLQDTYADGGDETELSPADLSPELTKHFRGLRLWLPLQVVGLAPFRAALAEKLLLARYFHERMRSVDGFEVGPAPDLSVVIYRYVPPRGDADAFNERLAEALRRDGRIFVSSTRLNGQFWLRMAAVGFRTHREDIDTAIEVLERTARRLAAL